jgi:acetate kinase
MKVLVLNSGSSSLKFQVVETGPEEIAANTDRLLAKGLVEKIGSSQSFVSCSAGGRTTRFGKAIPDHKQAIETAFGCLREANVLADLQEISGVGHRVVHGGEQFHESAKIDAEVLENIEQCIELAPLHNPHNLKGYYATRELLPHATQVAVFDTAFHHGMPLRAALYGIPWVYYTRDKIRRYGFHGTSHRYISYRFAQIHSRTRADYKLISCHLGNGCSVCAIDYGRSVDTSMGFTPVEGLMMGTRPGDLDAGLVMHLIGKGELGAHEVEMLLNKHSGLAGVSGISNDVREILRERQRGNERAATAIDMFCYRVRKYIGAYLAVLDGADALLLAGGIAENSAAIRWEICQGLAWLGIRLDPQRNSAAAGVEGMISADDSKVQVWVIPTNEELLIARDTVRLILGLPLP